MDEFDIDVSTVDPEDVDLRQFKFPPTLTWRGLTFKRDLRAYLDLTYTANQGGCEIQVSRHYYADDGTWEDWEAHILPWPDARVLEFEARGKTPYQALDRMMDRWLDKFEPWVRLAMSK